MESRDSSVWQTLAVTFGGGLALGAVGMKLSQNVRRPAEGAPAVEAPSEAGRVDQLERRLSRLERAPAPAAGAAAPLDGRTLEAIVRAVDGKLQEQSAKIDSQIAALEARMEGKLTAEMAVLRSEAAAASDASKARVQEVQSQFLEQMLAMRTAVVDELNQFGEAVSTLVADQVAAEMAAKSQALQNSLDAKISEAVTAAINAAMEEQLNPIRAEVERKERELEEVRKRLKDSESNVLEVILAIGQVCRQAAERIGPPQRPAAAPPVSTPPPAPTYPSSSHPGQPYPNAQPAAPKPPVTAPKATPMIQPPASPKMSAGIAPPTFSQSGSAGRLWRIPLVSSLLISTTGALLFHYLVL